MSTDDAIKPICYSSDSWNIPMLCLGCEKKLNEQFDSYGIAVFRGHTGSSRRTVNGVSFSGIDRSRLRHFFLSILWRMSVSPHEAYSNIDLPAQWEGRLHAFFQKGASIPSSLFTIGVYKLKDSTPDHGFSHEDLRCFIVAPFARKYGEFISVCFLFFGFLIEIFLPGLPASMRKRPGVMQGANSIFLAPYQEIDAVPEMMKMLIHTLEKHKRGFASVAHST